MQALDLNQYWPSEPMTRGLAAPRPDLAVPPAMPEATEIEVIAIAEAAALAEVTEPDDLDADQPPLPKLFTENRDNLTSASALARMRKAAANRSRQAKTFLRSFDVTAALWASTGFVAGVIAWHVIGFWGFVADTVLARGERTGPSAWVHPTAPHLSIDAPIVTGSLNTVAIKPEACVALLIDRPTGDTSAAPCPADAQPLRDAGRQRRGNLGAGEHTRLEDSNKAWAAGTELDGAAEKTAPELSEFDLTLSPNLNSGQVISTRP